MCWTQTWRQRGGLKASQQIQKIPSSRLGCVCGLDAFGAALSRTCLSGFLGVPEQVQKITYLQKRGQKNSMHHNSFQTHVHKNVKDDVRRNSVSFTDMHMKTG